MPDRGNGSENKQAEKEYLARTKSEQWELTKPFPFSNEYSPLSLNLIWEFVTAVKHLQPNSRDLILDLGAGSCWVSEWLQRLGLKPVSLDISIDMLRVGKRRLPRPGFLLVGDSEALPLLSESVSRVLCVNAFHHVANMRVALTEIHRVLRPDGFAVFCEPGLGHSEHPTSKIAMRDFGVLEQDIVISDFMELCAQAGFVDVQLKPTSHIVPSFGLSIEEWKAWTRFWARRRPIRAVHKLFRDIMEVFGVGKKSYLLEETFAIKYIRMLKGQVEANPTIAAYKTIPLDSRYQESYNADIQITNLPQTAHPGFHPSITVVIRNQGNVAWPNVPSGSTNFVQLGIQLLDSEKRLIDRDFIRKPLKYALNPGGEEEINLSLPLPDKDGIYYLLFDMVNEGISWFELLGSNPAIARVEITNGKVHFSNVQTSFAK